MDVYRIANWDARYEVTLKGEPAQGRIPIELRRKSKLTYVRSPVHGLSIGPGLDELFAIAWRPGEVFHWAVFGIFHKLLEIAAAQERDRRGWLLDSDGNPVTPTTMARRFHEPESESRFAEAFEMLIRVGWLEMHKMTISPGSFREIPEDSGRLYNRTELNRTDTKQFLKRTADPKAQKLIQELLANEQQRIQP